MNLAPTKEWCLKQRRAYDSEMKKLVARGGKINEENVSKFEEKMALAEAEAQELSVAQAADGLSLSAELVSAAVLAALTAQKAAEAEAETPKPARRGRPAKQA